MKTSQLSAALGFIGGLALALGFVLLYPVQAQSEADTWRELLVTIQEKQPSTFVYIQVNLPFNISANGQITHIGDNYVCVSFEVNTSEDCVPFDKVVTIELAPGIHR